MGLIFGILSPRRKEASLGFPQQTDSPREMVALVATFSRAVLIMRKNDMKKSLMRIAASMIVCGACLCAHGFSFTTKTGVKKSAVAEAKSAAEKGDAAAQFRYAEMLRDGRDVAKNMREAVRWTRKAADAGHAPAQCQMGLFYMNGLGVDHDEDKAVEWLNKAAAQNHVQAQYNLGIYYAKFSDKEACRLAVKWLNEAAKYDYADAQYNLAKLYLNSQHPTSREQGAGRRAISLLRRAAAQGNARAKEMLKELGVKE